MNIRYAVRVHKIGGRPADVGRGVLDDDPDNIQRLCGDELRHEQGEQAMEKNGHGWGMGLTLTASPDGG